MFRAFWGVGELWFINLSRDPTRSDNENWLNLTGEPLCLWCYKFLASFAKFYVSATCKESLPVVCNATARRVTTLSKVCHVRVFQCRPISPRNVIFQFLRFANWNLYTELKWLKVKNCASLCIYIFFLKLKDLLFLLAGKQFIQDVHLRKFTKTYWSC